MKTSLTLSSPSVSSKFLSLTCTISSPTQLYDIGVLSLLTPAKGEFLMVFMLNDGYSLADK